MRVFKSIFAVVSIFFLVEVNTGQAIGSLERQRGEMMLQDVVAEIKRRYYDVTLRGIDLDAKAKVAKEKIKKANSNSQIMGIIAQVVMGFEDSHTFFTPPQRADRVSYGWTIKMVGDKAFVAQVQPKSDADAKGLKPGDQIAAIDNVIISRSNLWVFQYFYYSLQPRPMLRLAVISPGSNTEREIEVKSKLIPGKRVIGDDDTGGDYNDQIRDAESAAFLRRHRFVEFGKQAYVWKMPQFDMEDSLLDGVVEKFSKYEGVIIDLRGNGGGYVKMLDRLVGSVFDKDIKIADWKGRKEYETQIAKSRKSNAYAGKLILLIDSESASAAEIFARVVQMEKRGTVIGDLSSGRVMVSRRYSKEIGTDAIVPFAVSVTEADLIMADGKSLEKNGVSPDIVMLPSASDMASGRDPVLARAAEMLGVKLNPVEAGKLFPFEWSRSDQ